ncbi:DHH family phosphoesterase [Halosegnis marinus]|uniref:Bifunctional oligoribonuclease/PAP phosphatase NrnA n=1 Tax=Halosegnis marinus TaxID=3034023 RepID=A0ABD5ZRK3_9EURY|nr:DHH family phosphoesterase [Halosegnis sp. DT85]
MATAPAGSAAWAPEGAVRSVGTAVEQRPELFAAAVVVGLVLVALAVLALRRFRRHPGERLRRTLAEHDSVAILMHPDPDPDAMGSALGLAHLADTVGTETRLCYPGEIRRHENRAFRTVLDLDFERVTEAAELFGEAVVVVDHDEPRGFEGAETVEPLAVVDHHPGDGVGTAFTDVRDGYGACATIVTEYLRGVGMTPDGEGDARLPAGVASALLYGIQTDTTYLSRGCSAAEFDCCEFLFPAIDGDVLDRIANPPVDSETLDVKARAIRERTVRMPFVVSDVGTVSNVDTVPQAAEELLRLEGATAVVVFGEKDGVYHLSGRSRDDRVHMGHALELAVAELIDAGAGGHARMGGGQVPDDGVAPPELADRLFTAMNGEEA